jgi:hypothetical protein
MAMRSEFKLRFSIECSLFERGRIRPSSSADVIRALICLAHRFPEGFKIVFSLVEKGKAEEYAFFSPLCSG